MEKNEKLDLLTYYEKRTSSLFNDLVDKEKNITPYDLALIAEEIKHIDIMIKDLKKDSSDDNNKLSLEEKKGILRYLLMLIITMGISCFAPGLFPIILIFIFKDNLNKKDLNKDNNIEDIENILKKLRMELQNCQTFINYRKNIISGEEKSKKQFTEFDFANSVINYFLENPTISTYHLNDYTEEIKFYIIKILQDNLNVDINNIESLMICARSQILKECKEYKKIEEYSRTRKNDN